jgi:hypothetical protein
VKSFLSTNACSAVRLAVNGLFLLGACQRPPTLMPVAPLRVQAAPDGGEQRLFDRDQDSQPDYAELLESTGRIGMLQIDGDDDGILDDPVILERIPGSECRQLFIILDSIPYQMVADLWQQGRFRYFHPPCRTIAPFPVMTDLSMAEFFGLSPTPGVESATFDGTRLTEPISTYATAGNAPWLRALDHFATQDTHAFAYLWPRSTYADELRSIESSFFADPARPVVVNYMVSTSAQGAKYGRNGHQWSLVALDRFCQALMARTEGRLQITLLSDHGHNLLRGTFVQLSDVLPSLGYRVTSRPSRPGDVVIPEWGLVTCAAMYTSDPAPLAADVVGLEGIDLAAYVDDQDEVVVLNRTGRARIARRDGRLRYVCEYGDPLQLLPIVAKLPADADGFVDDAALFAATAGHVYPDAAHRLWRAFHGLVTHTPQVLLSLDENYYCGSAFMSGFYGLRAAHGALYQMASYGFVMTTAGQLPETMRMETLAAELQSLGLRPRHRLESGEP